MGVRARALGMMAGMLVICGFGLAARARQAAEAKAQAVVIVVKDPSGTAVPGARVRVAPVAEKAPEKMETNEKGELTLQLSPGEHGLVVQSQGFKSFIAQLEVKTGAEAQQVSVVLQVGTGGGPVMVEAGPEKGVVLLTVMPFPEKFRITAAELKGMPRKTLTVHNTHSNADETYEGVLLADLLTKYGAPVGKEFRGTAVGCYVVATGSDGYKAVFSLAEVDPSFHPGDVVLADTMDGKPLDARSGPFKLVVSEDKRPARSVRNLMAVEVKGE